MKKNIYRKILENNKVAEIIHKAHVWAFSNKYKGKEI